MTKALEFTAAAEQILHPQKPNVWFGTGTAAAILLAYVALVVGFSDPFYTLRLDIQNVESEKAALAVTPVENNKAIQALENQDVKLHELLYEMGWTVFSLIFISCLLGLLIHWVEKRASNKRDEAWKAAQDLCIILQGLHGTARTPAAIIGACLEFERRYSLTPLRSGRLRHLSEEFLRE